MRKKILLTALILISLCLPVQARTLSSWLWVDGDALGARVGTEVSENVEVGLSSLWLPDREKPVVWGVYGVFHLPKLEVPNPIVAEFLPETISGSPYFGAKIDIDFNVDQSMTSPIAGVVFNDLLFLEYQFDSIDRVAIGESKLIFGLRIEF